MRWAKAQRRISLSNRFRAATPVRSRVFESRSGDLPGRCIAIPALERFYIFESNLSYDPARSIQLLIRRENPGEYAVKTVRYVGIVWANNQSAFNSFNVKKICANSCTVLCTNISHAELGLIFHVYLNFLQQLHANRTNGAYIIEYVKRYNIIKVFS